MTITKRGFICLAACMLGASLFAGHHHHRKPLPPNAYVCPKCDGDGYNRTWYGWKKECGVCDGRGWCVRAVPPPPVPPPVIKPHGAKPHGGAPAPHHDGRGHKGGPKGGPRR